MLLNEESRQQLYHFQTVVTGILKNLEGSWNCVGKGC